MTSNRIVFNTRKEDPKIESLRNQIHSLEELVQAVVNEGTPFIGLALFSRVERLRLAIDAPVQSFLPSSCDEALYSLLAAPHPGAAPGQLSPLATITPDQAKAVATPLLELAKAHLTQIHRTRADGPGIEFLY